MKFFSFIFLAAFLFAGCAGNKYYVVRHAEKESAGSDPELTVQGQKRAETLKDKLSSAKIGAIYSTNTIRTRSTVEPLSKLLNVPIQAYGPVPDSSFINKIKGSKKNVLIVGHSNTVDDIVNMLAGEKKLMGNLAENAFDDLFTITVKGKKVFFSQEKY